MLISAEIKGGWAKLILINPVEVAGFVSGSIIAELMVYSLLSLIGVTRSFGASSILKV